MIKLYCEAIGKLLAQAGFELAHSGKRSDALPIDLLGPMENDLLIQPIMFTCCPEDDSNRV